MKYSRLFSTDSIMNVLVYIVFLAVMISPRIGFGSISLRLEDFVFPLVFLLITCLALFSSRLSISKKVWIPIFFYLFYNICMSCLFCFMGELGWRAVLYLLKECLFFSQFILVLFWGQATGICQRVFNFEKFIILLILINILYGCFQIFSGQWFGFYGVASIGDQASAASGNAFFICFVLSIYLRMQGYGILLTIFALISFLCLVATFSRTFIVGGMVFLFLLLLPFLARLLIRLFANGSIARGVFKLTVLAVIFLGIANIFASESEKISAVGDKLIFRLGKVSDAAEYRGSKSIRQLELIENLWFLIWGRGKGFPEWVKGTSILAVDNQYVRNLMEMGLAGTFIWFVLIFKIAGRFNFDLSFGREGMFWLAFLATYLIMSIPLEIFSTARSGAFFWLLTGYLLVKQKDVSLYFGDCSTYAVKEK